MKKGERLYNIFQATPLMSETSGTICLCVCVCWGVGIKKYVPSDFPPESMRTLQNFQGRERPGFCEKVTVVD